MCKAVLNSGLEKNPEFLSEKGDFCDSSYRYVRQDENHKYYNQHFQDFAAVCQLHDPACQRQNSPASRFVRIVEKVVRKMPIHCARISSRSSGRRTSFSIGFSTAIVGTSYTKISSDLMISSARLRMLFIRRTHSS